MRRADRLFQIIQLMRRRHVITAAALAHELEVSERTVYRDISDLVASGVPIDGEAGVGYTLRRGFDLPPLMFTEAEVEAMVLGARVVTSWGDEGLARAATGALARIEAALPEKLKARLTSTPLYVPGFHVRPQIAASLSVLREAIDANTKVWFAYTSGPGEFTERTVRPLGLFFWGTVWSLEAWCELRDDFRSFRLDRIGELRVLEDRFAPERGRTLDDFFQVIEAENESRRQDGDAWTTTARPT
ncbi:MAG: YafY family transcriptional regulator [Chloroflexi bacterium]|nr:YafY family transcriptional regulator [Chloroflexota bacterium]